MIKIAGSRSVSSNDLCSRRKARTMAIAKLLGRIGMLIVTLSIGVALAAMPTVAFAEPDAGSAASSSESSSTDSSDDSASTASQSGSAESASDAHTGLSGAPAAGALTAPTSTDSPRVADPTGDGGPVAEAATSASAEPPNTEQAAAGAEVEASATMERRDNRAYFGHAAERLEQEVRSIPDSTRNDNGSSELHTGGSRASGCADQ